MCQPMLTVMVEEGGFEPPKSMTADLQSAPFGRSGTLPIIKLPDKIRSGAGGRTRTPDLLITNQLLYQLSYTSVERSINISQKDSLVKRFFKKIYSFLFFAFLLVFSQYKVAYAKKNGLCRNTVRGIQFTLSLPFSFRLQLRFWDKQHRKAL